MKKFVVAIVVVLAVVALQGRVFGQDSTASKMEKKGKSWRRKAKRWK